MTWPNHYFDDGSAKPPRTTALCISHMHSWCIGSCMPLKEHYLPGESTHETVACECPCHPVIVVEEDPS